MEEETLFHLAVEKPADERAAFVQQACAGDVALRQRVTALIEAHENPATFMQPPVERLQPITLNPPTLSLPPGTVIGRYKLLEPIGEGGPGPARAWARASSCRASPRTAASNRRS